jgi:hypothetical protein
VVREGECDAGRSGQESWPVLEDSVAVVGEGERPFRVECCGDGVGGRYGGAAGGRALEDASVSVAQRGATGVPCVDGPVGDGGGGGDACLDQCRVVERVPGQ